MNSNVLHKAGSFQKGITSSLSRKNRRRCCSSCRTFIMKGATSCSYCGQRVLTRWHKLLLGATILILSLLLFSVLNSLNI
jgi:hypothetical protein